jgi:hypothetical protein
MTLQAPSLARQNQGGRLVDPREDNEVVAFLAGVLDLEDNDAGRCNALRREREAT